MDTEDEELVFKLAEVKDLEVMSIDALNDYIEELRLEIKRVKDEIEIKKDARLGAQSVFRS